MSEHIAQEIVFTGRKPSLKQVMTKVMTRVNQGHTLIEVYWGEHGITLDKQSLNGRWCGFGWLKDIDSDTIAREINRTVERDTLNLYNT